MHAGRQHPEGPARTDEEARAARLTLMATMKPVRFSRARYTAPDTHDRDTNVEAHTLYRCPCPSSCSSM